MGICQSQQSESEVTITNTTGKSSNSKEIAGFELHNERKHEVKMLLLGAAESGKSTLLKQIQIIHLHGFSKQSLIERKPIVIGNTLEAILRLLHFMYSIGLTYENQERLRDESVLLRRIASNRRNGASVEFDERIAKTIRNLWSDGSIQLAYKRRSECNLIDTAQYLFESVDRFSGTDFVPTVQDVLNSRETTTGTVEMKFSVNNCDFLLIDVGGQRTERKKWIHSFEKVDAIMYIIAISEFDQVLLEDGCTNRLQEAMLLYQSILNNPWFSKAAIILFLNKRDIFLEKIKAGKSINTCFADYTGDVDYRDSLAFVKHKLRVLNETPETRYIYTHDTCANDTAQVSIVIKYVLDSIVMENLDACGLI